MRTPSFIAAVEKQLSLTLPGRDFQKKMAPIPRQIPSYIKTTEDEATPSAVLILLFREDRNWLFLLTKRSSEVEHHRGQISLPGGAQEDGETLQETALRETHEELGIETERVTILGELTPLLIPASGFRVHPFVGWMTEKPETSPDGVEVVSVLSVSTDELLARENMKWEKWDVRGINMDVPFFDFPRATVWGATAMILSEFRRLLDEAQSS